MIMPDDLRAHDNAGMFRSKVYQTRAEAYAVQLLRARARNWLMRGKVLPPELVPYAPDPKRCGVRRLHAGPAGPATVLPFVVPVPKHYRVQPPAKGSVALTLFWSWRH